MMSMRSTPRINHLIGIERAVGVGPSGWTH
jgi:hypothetical protein